MLRITLPELGTILMKLASCNLSSLLSDPLDHRFWHFAAGSYLSFTLKIHFVVRSCRSWIFKFCSALRSWRSWILRNLDPKFSIHCGILEIVYLYFLLLQWDPGDTGS